MGKWAPNDRRVLVDCVLGDVTSLWSVYHSIRAEGGVCSH
jgi:hypothetical protein